MWGNVENVETLGVSVGKSHFCLELWGFASSELYFACSICLIFALNPKHFWGDSESLTRSILKNKVVCRKCWQCWISKQQIKNKMVEMLVLSVGGFWNVARIVFVFEMCFSLCFPSLFCRGGWEVNTKSSKLGVLRFQKYVLLTFEVSKILMNNLRKCKVDFV